MKALNIHGQLAAQSINIYDAFPLLKSENFNQIVEIGTCRGGFTLFLRDIFPECHIFSYDISAKYLIGDKFYENGIIKLKEKNIIFQISDVFSRRTTEEIMRIIKSNGKSLIVCDGGDKIKEFNLFSKFLKSQDIIMCHDYSYDFDTFNSKIKYKIWNWMEVMESDILESCRINNLYPYFQEEFSKSAWAIRKKR